jgi:hypothetical protein
LRRPAGRKSHPFGSLANPVPYVLLQHLIKAVTGGQGVCFSSGTVNIIWGDVRGLRLKLQSPIELSAETMWEGEPSPRAYGAKVSVHMLGTQLMGRFPCGGASGAEAGVDVAQPDA